MFSERRLIGKRREDPAEHVPDDLQAIAQHIGDLENRAQHLRLQERIQAVDYRTAEDDDVPAVIEPLRDVREQIREIEREIKEQWKRYATLLGPHELRQQLRSMDSPN